MFPRLIAALILLVAIFSIAADEAHSLLNKYCSDCHADGANKGQISLDGEISLQTWERVIDAVERGEMPPRKKPQPTVAERAVLISWIEKAQLKCDCNNPDPGRVTIRRLNRAEYNNTIRELLGVDFRPADDFPVDDSG